MSEDINLNNKTEMILFTHHILDSRYTPQTIEEAIRELYNMTTYFNSLGYNRPLYQATATIDFNSNSWLRGLLIAAGVGNIPTPWGELPGWNSPVLSSYFGVNRINIISKGGIIQIVRLENRFFRFQVG